MHAMRAGVHMTLGSSPGSLVFNRDMFLQVPLIADWTAITMKREHLINKNLMPENRRRHQYDYQPQQQVLKKNTNQENGRVVHIPLKESIPMAPSQYN